MRAYDLERSDFPLSAGFVGVCDNLYLGIVLIGIAAGLFVAGGSTEVWVLFLPAVALYIVGLIVFIMGSFAVMLKLLTDAIVDHVTERLASGQPEE